ncbi:MAG: hypothetical protein ACOCVF_02090 [bacterium]
MYNKSTQIEPEYEFSDHGFVTVKEEPKTNVSKPDIDINALKRIGIYLDGLKQGKGGGTLYTNEFDDLKNLWKTISYLQDLEWNNNDH